MAVLLRRNAPGTKAIDFYNWPEQNFEDMDSTLAVQQYIQQMIRRDNLDIESILSPPAGQDEGVWKYEHLRQVCMELNTLAVKLQEECTPETCSQMTATEQWIFLCAAHKTPKECSAIDYTRHTLDGAASLLNGSKYFPSRVSIKDSSVSKLGSVCRRVYRIFSHAYYHHRHIFDEFENESYLCHRFTVYVIKYNLMSRDNLIVPILDDSIMTEEEQTKESDGPSHSILVSPRETQTDEKKTEDESSSDGEADRDGFMDGGADFGTMKPSKTPLHAPESNSNNNNSENYWSQDITIGAGGEPHGILTTDLVDEELSSAESDITISSSDA